MHVLVAGCGWLGAEVARVAAGRGDQVTAVRREAARSAPLRDLGVELISLDLATPGATARLPRADAVVACQAAGGEGVDAYRAAYLSANAELLDAVARWGARMVYTGSTGVFGQVDGSEVDESTAPAPASAAAQVLVEAEEVIGRAARGGVHASILRLSGLYGPGRAGILERVRSGRLALGAGDDTWMNFCHRQDAAAFVLAVLARGEPAAVYHGSDAEPTRRRDVVSWVAAALDVLPHRDDLSRPGPNRRVLSTRTRSTLGLALTYPSFREGLAPIIALDARRGDRPAGERGSQRHSGE